MRGRDPACGVTLVEMLVALALFALIGTAGFTTLDTVLRVHRGTEDRLERLASLDLALQLFDQDVTHAEASDLQGSDASILLRLTGGVRVTYGVRGGELLRSIDDPRAAMPVDQALLDGVTKIQLAYFADRWSAQHAAGDMVQAVQLTLMTARGSVSRLVETGAP